MATKKTEKTDKASPKKKGAAPAQRKAAPAKKAAAKEKKPPKQKVVETKARHPKARVLEIHGGKDALAKSLAGAVAREDEDTDQIAARLKTASNAQLLRLAAAAATVKEKWGNREKLIAAIGGFENKAKDKDFLAKLETYSLPHLIDLALAAERRARA
jgi:hypothetical protein